MTRERSATLGEDIEKAWKLIRAGRNQVEVGRVWATANGDLQLRCRNDEEVAELVKALAPSATSFATPPSTEAQILAAKVVTKKGEFADLYTASTAALLLATEILNIAYPNGVPK